MIPAVVGGPLVWPQLLAGPTVLSVIVTPLTTSLGAWLCTMIPPSKEPLIVFPLTSVPLRVAPTEAVARTMPPRSGPVALNTPMWPVMTLAEMVPPVILPPVLWVA